MGHADDNLAETELPAALDDLLECRHRRLAAVQAKALGAGIFHVEEALEGLGLDQFLQDRLLAFRGEADLPPLDAVLDPGALLRVGNMHVLEADMTGISVLEDAEHLPERAELQPERAADIDRAVVIGPGEAVGLGLELGMLAAGDEIERVEMGGEMAAGPVGADQHARAQRVARRGQRLLLAQAALRRGRQRRRRSVLPGPGGPTRFGEHIFLAVVQTGEEGAPLRIERGGVLFVAGVELGEVGGVGALQERRVEKHLVQFMSGHRINLAGH